MSDIRVLHFLPYLDRESLASKFVEEILQGGESSCSFCILTTSKGYAATQWHGVKVFKMKTSCLSFNSHRRFLKIIEESKADIVHIHGIWNRHSEAVCRWAHECERAVVLSTYKGTMPWHLPANPLAPRFIIFQFAKRHMLRSAAAIHAVTSQEMKGIKKMLTFPFSHTPISNRVETVEYSVNDAEGRADFREVLLKMERLYRKVVDSNAFSLMSEADHVLENNLVALGAALYAGIGEKDIFLPVGEMKEMVKCIEAENWRRIQIHSSDQDVLPYVRKAYKFLGGMYDDIDIDRIERYRFLREKSYLDTSQPQIHRARMHQVSEDYERNETEQRLCIMLLNAKSLYDKGKLSRRNLADLYLSFRYETYDEYVLESMLDDLGIKQFTARILSVLEKTLLLDEGYIPIETINDRTTRRINRKLYKSDVQ